MSQQRELPFTPKQRPLTQGAAASRAEAAEALGCHADTIKEQLLDFIRSRGSYGSTDQEATEALDLLPDTCRARRVELHDAGQVLDSGRQRLTHSGRRAVVWVAASQAAKTGSADRDGCSDDDPRSGHNVAGADGHQPGGRDAGGDEERRPGGIDVASGAGPRLSALDAGGDSGSARMARPTAATTGENDQPPAADRGGPGLSPALVAARRQQLACPWCGRRRFWRSIHGPVICASCHPPAVPELVLEWFGGEGEGASV